MLTAFFAMMLARYEQLPSVDQRMYVYAVAHTDAHFTYIARRLDNSGFRQGVDYLCDKADGQACVVYSKDTLTINNRLPNERVTIVSRGLYVELQIAR